MSNAIASLSAQVRQGIANWVGERPATTIAVAAIRSGSGRVWIDGDPATPLGVLIESSLVPGEPQAFGEEASVLRLLEQATEWTCVEVDSGLADAIRDDFAARWGLAQMVIDVVHVLREPVVGLRHPLVRPLTVKEVRGLPVFSEDLIPDHELAAAAAERGRFFGAVVDGRIVGQGGSLAAGSIYADVGVHVASEHRRDGIASACASSACRALQAEGLVPVWSTSLGNVASLAVAANLGFVEVERLRYLVPAT